MKKFEQLAAGAAILGVALGGAASAEERKTTACARAESDVRIARDSWIDRCVDPKLYVKNGGTQPGDACSRLNDRVTVLVEKRNKACQKPTS